MKTTLKLKHRTSRLLSALTLQITRHRITRSITTSYSVSSAEWNESRQEIVIPESASPARQKELAAFSRKLKKDLHSAHSLAKSLDARNNYSSQDFVSLFREMQSGQLFCEHVRKEIKDMEAADRFGTAKTYRFAVASFSDFLGNKDVRIEKINSALIKSFEDYLNGKHLKKNTVSCYMRTLRAAYNRAMSENRLPVPKKGKDKPFSDVFTGNAKTQKRAIDTRSISNLATLKIEEKEEKKKAGIHSPTLSRDLFLFCFYTQGMSFTDMANLKKENVGAKSIRYKRKKTGQLITVETEDCMKEIIDRYADADSDYLFPILGGITDEYAKWKKTNAALTRYNKNLKKLAASAGLDVPLTGYVARHSWASAASQAGIPIATISRGMGHESEKTTRIYISQLDFSDVGRANRQVISRILSPRNG